MEAAGRLGLPPAAARLWDESLPVASGTAQADRYKEREVRRPLLRPDHPLRVTFAEYADGVCDLVLVAHRRVLAPCDLDAIASLLSGPANSSAYAAGAAGMGPGGRSGPPVPLSDSPGPAAPVPAPGSAAPVRPDWGLGDPRCSGTEISVPLTVRTPAEPFVPLLAAATALVLSRYEGGGHPELTVLVEDETGHDTVTWLNPPITRDTRTADLVADCRRALEECQDRPAPHANTHIGLIVTRHRPDDAYVPCLAPAFPLTVEWTVDGADTLRGLLRCDAGAVGPQIAEGFAQHLARAVESLSAGTCEAGDLELLDAAETRAVLAAGRTEAAPAHDAAPIHDHFRRIARARPDAPALSSGDHTLTYRELDARSDAAAAGLRAFGVRTGDLVGVCLERGPDLVVVLLGVLKAGAAYVPMDPEYPADRLAYTVRDAGIRLVVTDSSQFPDQGARRIHPDGLATTPRHDAGSPDARPAGPDDPAYVIYTSGSTGRPKGVVVPHRNVAALLAATTPALGLGPDDVWTLFHSTAFDFSVWEIWGCLLTGGHLIVVPHFTTRTPEDFYDLLLERQVTLLSQTPSAFSALREVDTRRRSQLALRLVVFGGEPVDLRGLDDWLRRHSGCRLINMFGITETTVHATQQPLTRAGIAAGSRSVGRALPGWSLSVRDEAGRVQPFGAVGEIYVSGAGVADGYLNRDDLTAERFVTDPATGLRTYRSGDLGRMHPDGQIDHLGRLDDQVKVRGYRIELGEIRSVLTQDVAVEDAAVVRETDGPLDAAAVRLAAYLVLSKGGSVDAVRARASRILPAHMIPAFFAAVPALPLTLNGKVDAAGLRALVAAQTATAPHSAHTTPDETGTAVALTAFRHVLGEQVGPDDDFFDLGGNSMLAVQVVGALRRVGLAEVTVRQLYSHPTAAEIARWAEQATAHAAG
ncbi:hypothetical protein BIV23_32705 [Streptomyces monashensis]|uniref:Carrier domain-containing protein n=1 Tax=Streptomyces monashensis TaxID=1678012 RepID=A0A1S2PS42_9ACTN|nr:hypothetical protein BIV23_32705 [Streptomyces monashensis]